MKITKEIKELVKLRVSEYYEAKKDEVREKERIRLAEKRSQCRAIAEEFNTLVAANIPNVVKIIQKELLKNYPDIIEEKKIKGAIQSYVGCRKLTSNYDCSNFTDTFVKDDEMVFSQEKNKILNALDAERENAILETIISLELGGTKDDLDAVLEKFRIPEAE